MAPKVGTAEAANDCAVDPKVSALVCDEPNPGISPELKPEACVLELNPKREEPEDGAGAKKVKERHRR